MALARAAKAAFGVGSPGPNMGRAVARRVTIRRRLLTLFSVAEVVEGKRVTWAEGFFDLIVVLAVTQVATLLGEHHRWWGWAGRSSFWLSSIARGS
jgi:hypothetical protein